MASACHADSGSAWSVSATNASGSGLLQLRGRLEAGNLPTATEPLRPYLRLLDAEVSVPHLPPLRGDLSIDPDEISAGVEAGSIQLGDLIELDPGDWELNLKPGHALELTVNNASAKVFGAAVTLTEIRIEAEDGAIEVSARADNLGTLLTGMLAELSGDIELRFGRDNSDRLSAGLTAEFGLSSQGFPDFGRRTLTYHSDDPDYPLRALISDLPGLPDHELLFGPSGSKVCVTTTASDGTLDRGPCFPPP